MLCHMICDVYEFVLHHVGQDKDSTDIWMDYIQFLCSAEIRRILGEQQTMHALRELYHHVVHVPVKGLKTFWDELKLLEYSLNWLVVEEVMNNLAPWYVWALITLCQLSNHTCTLLLSPAPALLNHPELILPTLPTSDRSEHTLLAQWKAYLKWEESDPLELAKNGKCATFMSCI
ncbi:hypothetical protein C0989_010895 [Termitomyces sp. Mn162]|nr:hypothetical protein C0989_010895 [Termitomyces sp. Mn162]